MTGVACRVGTDVAALQEIVQASDPIPAISVAFDDQSVAAALIRLAVILRQQIDEKLAGVARKARCERDFARFFIEIVHEQH